MALTPRNTDLAELLARRSLLGSEDEAVALGGRYHIPPSAMRKMLEDEKDPGWLARILGPFDAIGGFTRGINYNNALKTWENQREQGIDTTGERFLHGLQQGVTGGLGWLYRTAEANIFDRPEHAINPFQEAGRAFKGERSVSTADLIKAGAEAMPGLTEGERKLAQNETFQFVGGLIGDVFSDPTTYGSSGITAATKAARAAKVAELADKGLDAAKLASIGIDALDFAARHADDFKGAGKLGERLADGGTVLTRELGQDASDEIWEAATRWAQESVAGTKREAFLPFLRRSDETGRVGLGGFRPGIDTGLPKNATGTIFERGGWQPTLREWGAQGERIGVKMGTRAADRGGIKLFGQTILDVQPQLEKAGTNLWRGLNTNLGYSTAKGLVNRFSKVDIAGDRLLSTWARVASGDLDAARSIARQVAIDRGIALGREVDAREANLMGAGINEVLDPESWKMVRESLDERERVGRTIEILQKKHGLTSDEAIAAARGRVAGRAVTANEKLAALRDEQIALLDDIAARSEALGLTPKTSAQLRAAAATMAGEERGTKRALDEAERAIRAAKSDMDRFAGRAANLREKAKPGAAPVPAAPPQRFVDTLTPHTDARGKVAIDPEAGPFEWDYKDGYFIGHYNESYPAALDDPEASWVAWPPKQGDALGSFDTPEEAAAAIDAHIAEKAAAREAEEVRRRTPPPGMYLAGAETPDNPTTMRTAEPYYNMFGIERQQPWSHPEYATLDEYIRAEKGKVGELVVMTPEEYIERASMAMSEGWRESRNPQLIAEYAERMRRGEKAPALYVEYAVDDDGSVRVMQEGLHRAIAAREAGFDKVNVIVVTPSRPGRASKYSVEGKVFTPPEPLSPKPQVQAQTDIFGSEQTLKAPVPTGTQEPMFDAGAFTDKTYGGQVSQSGLFGDEALESAPQQVTKPPKTLDEYITSTFGEEALRPERADAIMDEMESFMVGRVIDDSTDEVKTTLSRLGWGKWARSKNVGRNAKKETVKLGDVQQRLMQFFPEYDDQAITSNEFLDMLADSAELAAKGATARTADELVELAGSDSIMDDIIGRVQAAMDSGDMKTAEAWQQLADEFGERITRQFKEIDPFFGDEATPIPLMRKKLPEPEKADKALKATKKAKTMRQRLDEAYQAGRATGHRQAARSAVDDAWRAAGRAGEARSRADEYETIIGGLSKRQEYNDAYKAISKAETRLRNMMRELGKYEDRFKTGAAASTRLDRVLRHLDDLEVRRMAAYERVASIVDSADYTRVEQFFIEHGVEPERAAELRAIVESLRDEMTEVLENSRSLGVGSRELLPGAGATGYFPKTNPEFETIFTDLRSRLAQKAGEHPATRSLSGAIEDADKAARADVMSEVFGVEWSDLKRPQGGLNAPVVQRSVRPEQPEAAVYKTVRERVAPTKIDPETGEPVVVPGRAVETDIRKAIPTKIQRELDNQAKAVFEDRVVASLAEPHVAGTPVPEGMALIPVIRNGERTNYIVPETVKSWVDSYEEVFITGESANMFFRGYDRIQNTLKAMMTMWNPAFHARNLPSNYFLAFATGHGDIASWTEAYRVMAAVESGIGDSVYTTVGGVRMSASQLVESVKGKVIRGMYGPSEVAQVVRKEASRRTPRANLLAEVGRSVSPTKVGSDVGSFIEDGGRLAVYLSGRRKGLEHLAAEMLPDRILYNYMPESFTAAEREGIKRLIPFYGWFKQNVPAQLENLMKNPGKLTWLRKMQNTGFAATDIDPTTLPEWMRELGMVPLPGKDEQGRNKLWNPSVLPWQDLARTGGGAKEAAQMVSPLIKSPAEVWFNYDVYGQREVETYDGETVRAPGYLAGIDRAMRGSELWADFVNATGMAYRQDEATGEWYLTMPAKARKLLKDFLPFAENIGRVIGEGREQDANKRLAVFTGIRVSDFDPAYYEEQQVSRLRSRIDDALRKLRDEGKIPEKAKHSSLTSGR